MRGDYFTVNMTSDECTEEDGVVTSPLQVDEIPWEKYCKCFLEFGFSVLRLDDDSKRLKRVLTIGDDDSVRISLFNNENEDIGLHATIHNIRSMERLCATKRNNWFRNEIAQVIPGRVHPLLGSTVSIHSVTIKQHELDAFEFTSQHVEEMEWIAFASNLKSVLPETRRGLIQWLARNQSLASQCSRLEQCRSLFQQMRVTYPDHDSESKLYLCDGEAYDRESGEYVHTTWRIPGDGNSLCLQNIGRVQLYAFGYRLQRNLRLGYLQFPHGVVDRFTDLIELVYKPCDPGAECWATPDHETEAQAEARRRRQLLLLESIHIRGSKISEKLILLLGDSFDPYSITISGQRQDPDDFDDDDE